MQIVLYYTYVDKSNLKKAKSRRYPAETTTDADNADDLAFLANTPAQAESQLHSPEQVAGGIRLYMNTNKTESMCFKQEGAISTSGRPLKFTSSHTSAMIFHQLKPMLTYAK